MRLHSDGWNSEKRSENTISMLGVCGNWWAGVMNMKWLTSGTNGGSTMPASSRFQLILLKNWCNLTSRAPYRPLRHPKRAFTVFVSSCWHNDLASSQNLSEYFSGSSYDSNSIDIDIELEMRKEKSLVCGAYNVRDWKSVLFLFHLIFLFWFKRKRNVSPSLADPLPPV